MRRLLLPLLAANALLATIAHAQDGHPPGAPTEAHAVDDGTGELVLPAIEVEGFRIKLGGYLQGQYQADQTSETQLAPDGVHLLNRDAFALRRGRLVVEVSRSIASILLELDGSTGPDGPQMRIFRAEASLQWPTRRDRVPYAALTAGLFRTPFGAETPRSPRDRVFMENSTFTRAFFPGEVDVGARVQGGVDWFRYAVAAVNGHPIDEPRFGLHAPTPSGDVVGRLGLDVSMGSLRLVAGLSLLGGTGFHPGTPATKNTLVVRNLAESSTLGPSDLQLVPGRSAVPSQTYGRWATGADVELSGSVGSAVAFWLRGEVAVAQNLDRSLYLADPVANGFDVRELGFSASLVQLYFRWLLLGVRFDYYDPALDATSRVGGVFQHVKQTLMTGSFAVGVQWPRTQDRLVLEYDRVVDHLALGGDGVPTDLRNDRITVRLQVAF